MAQLIGGLRRCADRGTSLIKEDIRDASGPNGGLTGNLDGFARLWATSDNEVDISDREGLIRRAKELSTSGIISLKENECQALRRLTIPIFPVPLRVLSENHIWTRVLTLLFLVLVVSALYIVGRLAFPDLWSRF
jgi:hypothetical protein